MTDDAPRGARRPSLIPSHAAKLRMAGVLERRAESEGGFAALARAISSAYASAFPDDVGYEAEQTPRDVVDRRKLRAIAAGREEFVLTSRELRALDTYLEPFGEGLSTQALFEKPNLIQTLARCRTASFLLGSRPAADEGVSFPHWDVLGMAEIQRRLTALQMPVALTIRNVPMSTDPSPAPQAEDSWSALFDEPDIALVAMASPRSMPASGAMLAAMCGCAPGRDVRLPFYFAWSERLAARPGPFVLQTDDIGDGQIASAVRAGGGSALVLEDRILLDTLTSRQHGSGYGVCVAQRRANGSVWLLLAGVSGPATWATASVAHHLSMRLGERRTREPSPVWWAVVAADARPGHQDAITDPRDLNVRIEVPPRTWQPPA